MRREEIELLAPAGSYEGFEAAIGAGADAVYVGGAAFGARAYAKNFGEEELLRAIDTAHIHGRKLYLTVNTLLKNRELSEQLYDYLLPYYKEGLDAVIVQDMGVFKMIREMFPGMHLHASTQMTVTGPEGMKFLEEQGASRVVTARELSLEEIRRMHETSPIEIESFIHGALCYSYSGQCLMSSILGGRSGNRGRCAQPCRLPYQTALCCGENGRNSAKRSGRNINTENRKAQELCPLSLKDLDSSYMARAEKALEWFMSPQNIEPDGFSKNVTQSNRIGDAFQRSGYRVIMPISSGLAAHVIAVKMRRAAT